MRGTLIIKKNRPNLAGPVEETDQIVAGKMNNIQT